MEVEIPKSCVLVESGDGRRLWPTGLKHVHHDREFPERVAREIKQRADVVGCWVGTGVNLQAIDGEVVFRIEDGDLGNKWGKYADLQQRVEEIVGRSGLIIIVA